MSQKNPLKLWRIPADTGTMKHVTTTPTLELARRMRNDAWSAPTLKERAVLLDGADFLYTLAIIQMSTTTTTKENQ